MLDITKQSDNTVNIVGTLSELEVKEGTGKSGKDYVMVNAKVRVDQDINGQLVESEIPVQTLSMKLKKDGSENPMYARAVAYKEQFISLAAAENPADASRVSINGNIEENSYYGQDGTLREGFKIRATFINKAKKDETDKATFAVTGVIGSIKDEEKNGEPTDRAIVKMTLVGWNKRADVVSMIASGSAKAHVESNWEVGDTVIAAGKINVSQKTEIIRTPMGFGEDIEKPVTVSKREILITSGSATGLEEALSYDADDIKAILAERKARLEQEKQNSANKTASQTKVSMKDLGF